MKKSSLLLITIFLCIAFQSNAQNSIYVSGSNLANGDGSLGNPFKTINLAVTAAASGDTIVVRQGIYREQVSLKKGNLNFISFKGEQVTINGADALLVWTKVKDSVYKSFMNWNVTESDQTNQVFYKGQMMDLARWPVNTGTRVLPTNAYADKVTAEGANYVFTDPDFQEPAGKWNGCEIWVNLSRSVKDYGYDGQGWSGRIVSSEPGKITIQGNVSGRISDEAWGLGLNTEYFLFNPTATSVAASGGIQNYLQPGQWWKKADTLFVRTSDDIEPSSVIDGTSLVEAKRRLYSFSFSDQSNLLIKGFNTFACAINTDLSGFWNRTSSVSKSSNITIDGIKAQYVTHFTNQAKNYQMQWNQRSGFIISGTNITLQNSEIQYSAGSGVSVFGRKNKILNNKIWDVNYSSSECGAMNTGLQYDPGLVISEDHEIGFNTIYNTPQQAINIRAITNSSKIKPGMARIHHNIIHDFMLKTHDSGAFDTYDSDGKWLRVDHNIVYNSNKFLAIGFYLDFGSNYIVDHNLFYNVERPIQLNFGAWGPNKPSDMWVFNNTALADKYNKNGIFNGAATAFSEGTNVLNNISSAKIVNSLTLPYLVDNFSVATAQEMNACFTNPSGSDYTLKVGSSKYIDTCFYAPFNDQIVNKPDAGCYESGTLPWKAGYGSMFKHFLVSDASFRMKTDYKVAQQWKFNVFPLPYSGFTGEVNLTLSDIPEGISATLSINKVVAGESTELIISASNTLNPGHHILKLEGKSGELSDTRYYTIEVVQLVSSVKIVAPPKEIKFQSNYLFTAQALDQVGNPMQFEPAFTWKSFGGGSFSGSTYKATSLTDSIQAIVKTGSFTDTCTFNVVRVVSAFEINYATPNIKLTPNPARQSARLEFKSLINGSVSIAIFSSAGKLVKQLNYEINSGQTSVEIDTKSMKSGIYIVRVEQINSIASLKLVIDNN